MREVLDISFWTQITERPASAQAFAGMVVSRWWTDQDGGAVKETMAVRRLRNVTVYWGAMWKPGTVSEGRSGIIEDARRRIEQCKREGLDVDLRVSNWR